MEGFLFTPRPSYGKICLDGHRIQSFSSRKLPRKIKTLILPGFISTHVHTIQTHARNHAENKELLDWLQDVIWPFEAKLNSKTAYESAKTGMKECLEFGITTTLDMATTRHTNSVFKAAKETGIRAYLGKALMDQGYQKLIQKNPLEEVYDHLNDWHGYDEGRLQVTLCPRFALSCSPSLLKEVGEVSKKYKLLHHTHASENKKENAWIQKKYKKSNIELLDHYGCLNSRTILAHAVHLTSKDRQLLRKRKVSISHCPASNLKLASGILNLKASQGINLSLGVDGAACNNLLDPFFEMRLAHFLSRYLHGLKGVSAENIFKMATRGGAKALHSQKIIGQLKEGFFADLLVIEVPERVNFNPQYPYESLLHSIQAADIKATYVQGRKVYAKK